MGRHELTFRTTLRSSSSVHGAISSSALGSDANWARKAAATSYWTPYQLSLIRLSTWTVCSSVIVASTLANAAACFSLSSLILVTA